MEALRSIQEFKYYPLNKDKNEIRLLRIFPHDAQTEDSQVTCELFHASLDNLPSFKALSYTWGSPNSPRHDIILNSQEFEVRDNLYYALQKFQSRWIDYRDPLILWVDAICIDQSNVQEQNHQVARMKVIYEMAEQVLIWLGAATECCEMAFEFVPKLDCCSNSLDEVAGFLTDHVDMLSSLSCLSNRVYWERMWIVQELTVAQEIIIYCGNKRMEGRALFDAQILLQRNELRQLVNQSVREDLNELDQLLCRGLPEIHLFKTVLDSKEHFSHFDCIRYHYEQQSKDPRDMIYGLVALANSKSTYSIHADYFKSKAQVYTEFAKAELKHSARLDILSWRNGSKDECLPSWVPDWSINCQRPLHLFLEDPKTPQFASWAGGKQEGIFSLLENTDVLVLKGIELETIEILGNRNVKFPNYTNSTSHPLTIPEVGSWWKMVCSHGGSVSIQIAFMRTMLLDRISDETLGLWPKSDLLRAILHPFLNCHTTGLVNDPIPSASLSFGIAKCEELSLQTCGKLEDELQNLNLRWQNCIYFASRYFWDRRFFINRSGIMGMVPNSTLAGDTICVAPGCPTPLILRRVDEHYILIGEAYIDQYMNGEAIEKLRRQELELQDFELH